MTTLTVNIQNEKDLPVLKEILTRFGMAYTVNKNDEYAFTEAEIAGLVKTKKDFLEGRSTTRNWDDIEEDLNSAYN